MGEKTERPTTADWPGGVADWLALKDRALDAAAEVTHFIGIQSDVTVRRLAEDGLRKAKQALLPPPEIQAGELRIAHAFQPCDDLAGDGVGVVSLLDNRLGIYMLDINWHGVGAALLSFTLAHLLSPTVEGSLPTENAGAGLPVGMMDEACYEDETLTLEPGDRLYCYTDGAIEALNAANEEFGLDRISAAFRAWSDGPLKDHISLLAIERLG